MYRPPSHRDGSQPDHFVVLDRATGAVLRELDLGPSAHTTAPEQSVDHKSAEPHGPADTVNDVLTTTCHRCLIPSNQIGWPTFFDRRFWPSFKTTSTLVGQCDVLLSPIG